MKAEAPIGCRGEVPRLGTGLPSIVGAGFIPPGEPYAAAGFPGRCKHRPLQRFAVRQGCRFPVGYGPSVDRRCGIYPARGRLRRRGGAGRCEHRPLQGLAARQGCRFLVGYGPSVDRRGGIYPARGPSGAAGSAGRCEHRPLQGFVVTRGRGFPGWPPHFPGWPRHSPSSVGVDSISARGCLPRRGVRRDEGIPPYGRPGGFAAVRFGGAFRKVCRGGPWPSRETLRHRGVPGTMQASSPTEVCGAAGARFPGWPRYSPSSVGVDSISARGRLCRRGVRRDEGIPPYGRPGGCGRPVWSEA